MKKFAEGRHADFVSDQDQLVSRYDEFCAMNLSLDMTRGKPCAQQLDIARELHV